MIELTGSENSLHRSGMHRAIRDLAIVAASAVVVALMSIWFDLFNMIISWIYAHETWQLDEVFTLSLFLVAASVVFSVRRWKELENEIRERRRFELTTRILEPQLEHALRELSTLRKLVPICAWCKSIRDKTGYWMPLEAYLRTFPGAEYTHGICPDCARKVFNGRSAPSPARLMDHSMNKVAERPIQGQDGKSEIPGTTFQDVTRHQ